MTKDPLTTLDALIAAGQAATPGEWSQEESDTNPGRPAVFADGGLTGVAQIAIMPREFSAAKENATFIALAKNAIPDLIALRERVKGLEAVAEASKETADLLTDWFMGAPVGEELEESSGRLTAAIATLEGK